MPNIASDLAHRLAENAEAVCRHYLPNGKRAGRYWLIGDIDNAPGRSLYVRLIGTGTGRGAAGKWTDAATGEHGDLLDVIAGRQRLTTLGDTLDEARRFLSLSSAERFDDRRREPVPTGSPEAARRLLAMSTPIAGTLAETYLRKRGIANSRKISLRFHPRCYYRADAGDRDNVPTSWPALIAAVTDLDGTVTGVHRTWLDPSGKGKAPVATPRRAMGHLLGNGVRFGRVDDTMVAGEGIETMLSLAEVLPSLPGIAALSANHLAALASCRQRFAACTSPATTIPLAIARHTPWPNALEAVWGRSADADATTRRFQRRSAAGAESMPSPPRCAFSWRPKTWHGSWPLKPIIATTCRRPGGSALARERRSTSANGRSVSRPRPSERAIGPEAVRAGNGSGCDYFPLHARGAHSSRGKIVFAFAVLRSRCGRAGLTPSAVPTRSAPGLRRRRRPRWARPPLTEADAMTTDDEPIHTESPTASLLVELQLYGHRPFQDEPDARPLPEDRIVRGALADIFDALVSTLLETRLEPDLEELLWGTVNLFHRTVTQIERELDTNEAAQKRSQRDQDGSEIASVELEKLLAEGLTLIERRNAFEAMRDGAAELFEVHTGSPWRLRRGSLVSYRSLTAAVIDSREFIAARRRAQNEVLVPAGPKIAFTGGTDATDHKLIWDTLDKVHAKHPGMVLLHGGSP